MRIKFFFGRPTDIHVEYDPKTNSLLLEPRFDKTARSKVLANIVVSGRSGAERQFTMIVNGADGKVNTPSVKPVEPKFDSRKPADIFVDEEEDEEEDTDANDVDENTPGSK